MLRWELLFCVQLTNKSEEVKVLCETIIEDNKPHRRASALAAASAAATDERPWSRQQAREVRVVASDGEALVLVAGLGMQSCTNRPHSSFALSFSLARLL